MDRIVRAAVRQRRRFGDARLETVASRTAAGASDNGQDSKNDKEGDGYLQRVAKYIPAEILGFFLFVNNILQEASKTVSVEAGKAAEPATMAGGDIKVQTVATLVFLLAWGLTPVYLWAMRRGAADEAWKLNALIAFLAFPVWAYAMNAVIFAGIHDGHLASILLATFTVCSGLIKPAPKDADEHDVQPDPKPDPQPAPDPAPTPAPAPAPADPTLQNDPGGVPADPPRN